ncbi:predicted protein [Naegleria gruberi]|uniref:Predicted protein n=1 Tax=Naegleria gruberi TaxID=5762 RepID=D2V7X4_NAEGR|nr:uncharacterized protein NAEGRDRAFT_64956 [Naegleria gruberi]EFC46941.1 predicted protein [Naegleria gruberi]|eukprot:XP_002679685.1 predicted protein [Naegleria gruberi strain NEG-M]
MCIVESEDNSKDVMYLFHSNNCHLLKVELDADNNFPILQETETKIIFGITFNKSKNEVIVLGQDRVVVYDGDNLLFKYEQLYMEPTLAIHYDHSTDELCTFSFESNNYYLRKYYGNSLGFSKCHEIVSFEIGDVEPIFGWKPHNFLVFYSNTDHELLLCDSSNFSLVAKVDGYKLDSLAFDRVTNTIFSFSHNKVSQLELLLETFVYDMPLSREIYGNLFCLQSKFPKTFFISNDVPLVVSYLRNIRLPRLHKFKHKEFRDESVISEIYDMNTEEVIKIRADSSVYDLVKFSPFEFRSKNLHYKYFKRFPNDKMFVIGTNFDDTFYIAVLLSELKEYGQWLDDFPIHIVSRKDESVVKCKLSDFIKTLKTEIYVMLHYPDRDEGSTGYEFKINTEKLYFKLGKEGCMDPETGKLNSNMLSESYRNIVIHSGFETILRIAKIHLKDQ